MAQAGVLAVLGNRNFRTYWLGQSVGLAGTWMQVMAQGWVLTSLSPEAWVLGAFNVAGSLPMLALGAHGGELADRMDKRRLLIITQAIMMGLAFGFGALVQSGHLVLWHVFALAAVTSVVEAFEFPASQGMGPELVDREHIPQAVGMMQAIFHAGRLLGPALAGVLIARLGEASAFYANGVSFLAVIGTLMLVRQVRPVGVQAHGSGTGAFSEGWTYVKQDATTWALLVLQALAMTLVFPFMVLLSFYARHVLGLDAVAMGEMLSSSGVGALTGAMVLLAAPPSSWMVRLWVGTLGSAAALMGMAVSHRPVEGMALVGVLSFCTTQMMGTVNQTVQAKVPDGLRGRVGAVFGMAFTSVLPVTAMITTTLVDAVGMHVLLLGFGGTYAVVSSALLLRLMAAERRAALVV